MKRPTKPGVIDAEHSRVTAQTSAERIQEHYDRARFAAISRGLPEPDRAEHDAAFRARHQIAQTDTEGTTSDA